MRLDDYSDLADFGHSILGRIVGILLHDTLSLGRLCPVLFEYAIVYPFLT